MNINQLQEEIDKTDYWDMAIFDVQFKYFGDEIYLYVENDNTFSWKISFYSCYKVSYVTDADWREESNVKNLKKTQLGYDGQDISVMASIADKNFIDVSMDLSIMTMKLTCKDINVEQIENEKLSFFWEHNER